MTFLLTVKQRPPDEGGIRRAYWEESGLAT